jgi:Tol biopolymer transport system component
VVIVGGKPDVEYGQWIVFARENDVWRARPDGSIVERIVDLPADAQVMGIAVSPDGSRLAYLEYYGEFSASNRVVLTGIDGSNPRTLVNTGGNGASGVCDFHPDGTHVMYWRDIAPGGGQNYELYEVSLDGLSDVNLTNHPNNEGCGSYSPTGDRITFASGTPFCSACGDIYTQNHDGTGRERIFDLAGDSDNTPIWSPDIAQILISSRYPGDQEDLYLIDPDGSNPIRLTSTFGVRERYKAWSPGGSRIVFERSNNLYLINRDGSGEVLFLENATRPDWGGSTPGFASIRDEGESTFVEF